MSAHDQQAAADASVYVNETLLLNAPVAPCRNRRCSAHEVLQ